MHKHSLSLSIMIVGALVAVFHVTALNFSLYWVISWFDIMMHFLGGALVGLFGVWVYGKLWKDKLLNDKHYNVLFNVVIFVTIVGLFWETFELLFDVTSTTRLSYKGDTSLDFIMNTIGAIIGYFYAKWVIEKIDG